jgi:hypothetical protein
MQRHLVAMQHPTPLDPSPRQAPKKGAKDYDEEDLDFLKKKKVILGC